MHFSRWCGASVGPKLQYKEQKQKTYVQQVNGEVAQVPLDHLLVSQLKLNRVELRIQSRWGWG